MPEEDVAKVSESMWELIGKAFKHSNANSATIPASESLLDFIKEHADEQIRESFPIKYQASKDGKKEQVKMSKKELLLSLSEQWGSFVGGSVETQSLKFFWLEECLDGENLFCAGTYAKVLELVAKPALAGADVRFEHVVTKIRSEEQEGNPRVTIETANGVSESFDEVVVTTPLGWLKRNQHVFEPDLPERIVQGIDSLGYGNLDKVHQSSMPIKKHTDPSRSISLSRKHSGTTRYQNRNKTDTHSPKANTTSQTQHPPQPLSTTQTAPLKTAPTHTQPSQIPPKTTQASQTSSRTPPQTQQTQTPNIKNASTSPPCPHPPPTQPSSSTQPAPHQPKHQPS